MRFKSYSDFRNSKIAAETIKEYTQLKTRDINKLPNFMSNSPRQEFEKELR